MTYIVYLVKNVSRSVRLVKSFSFLIFLTVAKCKFH